jgi:hypothetical protein
MVKTTLKTSEKSETTLGTSEECKTTLNSKRVKTTLGAKSHTINIPRKISELPQYDRYYQWEGEWVKTGNGKFEFRKYGTTLETSEVCETALETSEVCETTLETSVVEENAEKNENKNNDENCDKMNDSDVHSKKSLTKKSVEKSSNSKELRRQSVGSASDVELLSVDFHNMAVLEVLGLFSF